jgi:hypothetical protein
LLLLLAGLRGAYFVITIRVRKLESAIPMSLRLALPSMH